MRLVGGRFRLGDRAPGRSVFTLWWWDLSSLLCELCFRLIYRIKVRGGSNVPDSGPLILISNHQSYFDPIINSTAASKRPYTAIAGSHLTRFKPFGWLLKSYGTVFVSASAGDKGPLKAAISELKKGRVVLVYPEGTRSPDGFVCEFQKGLLLLLRRAPVPVVPLGLDGAQEIWPRGRSLPRLRGRVAVVAGRPIPPEELLELEPDQLLGRLRKEIDTLRLEARTILRDRSGGRWPPPGPNDEPSPDP